MQNIEPFFKSNKIFFKNLFPVLVIRSLIYMIKHLKRIFKIKFYKVDKLYMKRFLVNAQSGIVR